MGTLSQGNVEAEELFTQMLYEVYFVDEAFLGDLVNELCNVNEIEKSFQIYLKMIDVGLIFLYPMVPLTYFSDHLLDIHKFILYYIICHYEDYRCYNCGIMKDKKNRGCSPYPSLCCYNGLPYCLYFL